MKKKDYFKLFRIMFTLSAFTFGGGYVIVSLMKNEFVDRLKWIEEEEMLNLVAIAQSSPGAVAVNGSILVGYKVGGIRGAIVSILGTILPPFIILSIISVFYNQFKENIYVSAFLKAMQPAIAAIIISVVIQLGKNIVKQKELYFIIIMVLAFIFTYFLNINIIFVILACAVLGGVYALYKQKKEVK
ncbi:MAG: chromate transporter [Pleomorphochaeta sp.]